MNIAFFMILMLAYSFSTQQDQDKHLGKMEDGTFLFNSLQLDKLANYAEEKAIFSSTVVVDDDDYRKAVEVTL
jgi:hypothetical protein